MYYRIPNQKDYPHDWVNRVVQGDSLELLRQLPDNCISLIVTSPPYWDFKDYGVEGQIGQSTYEDYINDLLAVWKEAHRVLIPNGKLAIVTPIMPIPKKIIGSQHTRHLKNINNDIEFSIMSSIPGFLRYDLFVWQKPTTIIMFGSYPYPPNLYENNTVEFINVFVKEGKPPKLPKEFKDASKITKDEWQNLTMQVWSLQPHTHNRDKHPAPYPVTLPLRLIKMYSFASADGFAGDIVLDMFNGSGSTCLAAKATGRNYIGFDLNSEYCKMSIDRLHNEIVNPNAMFLKRMSVSGGKTQEEIEMMKGS